MNTKVFISWSGPTSQRVAESLREWLKSVIQAVEPWMSEEDIAKGSRWSPEIASQLEQCKVGIICLTPDNLTAPWIHFEAGALSKTLDNTFVCPYLFRVDIVDLVGPLTQFNATRANKEDTNKLVHSINKAQDGKPLPEQAVDKAFEVWWPDLERELETITSELATPEIKQAVQRTDRDVLEEVLLRIRALEAEAVGGIQPRTIDFTRIQTIILEDLFRELGPTVDQDVLTKTIRRSLLKVGVFGLRHKPPGRLYRAILPEGGQRVLVFDEGEEDEEGDF